MVAKSKRIGLKGSSKLTIHTTTLELENFVRELTGHPISILSFYHQEEGLALDSTIGSKETFDVDGPEISRVSNSSELCNMWRTMKESGEVSEYLTLPSLLAILAMNDYIKPATYIIEVVEHKQKSVLSEEIKDILHDAVMKACSSIVRSKDSDLHVNMMNEVWAAADRVLRAHNNS